MAPAKDPGWDPEWDPEPEMPPVCRASCQLARDAMAPWSPVRHWLFHKAFRAAVHTVLLVRGMLIWYYHALTATVFEMGNIIQCRIVRCSTHTPRKVQGHYFQTSF